MVEKKNAKFDITRYRGMFFNVGLVLSLSLVLMAFEWKTPQKTSKVVWQKDIIEETLIDIPATVIPPPPKPEVQLIEKIVEKPDDEIIEETKEIYDIMTDPTEVITEPVFVEEIPEEETDEPFIWVEEFPSFNGGDQANFLQYISGKLKYPALARRMGIEGKVFVQFVVNRDGRMTDIQVIKGIGAGCDEEVLRVMKDAPKWEPGKQRGKPVKVRMIVPVRFTLDN